MNYNLSNERKYIATLDKKDHSFSMIQNYCILDPIYPVGKIRSIYFDSLSLRSYREKIEGDNLKVKVRLRWYNEESNQNYYTNVFIEMKYRIGSARFKSRHAVLVRKDFIENIELHNFKFLKWFYGLVEKHSLPVPDDLFPVIRVSYSRFRYACSFTGTRVALDLDIYGDAFNRDILPCYNTVHIPLVVCEFKSHGLVELPWASELYSCGFRLRSFSKYGECMNRSINGSVLWT